MRKLVMMMALFGSLNALPCYEDYPNVGKHGDGSYLSFVKDIDKNRVKIIFEIGSRDALDAIDLSQYFKAHVVAFECNPYQIPVCRENIGNNPNVTLEPYGVWDSNGYRDFYRVIDKNPGASSFFESNTESPYYKPDHPDATTQEKIVVPCIRLDDYLEHKKIGRIDLLCMDVQGAAYQVLESLGTHLKRVKYIIVELETQRMYVGEKLYDEVDQYLRNSGFIRLSPALDPNGLFGDVLYMNTHIK